MCSTQSVNRSCPVRSCMAGCRIDHGVERTLIRYETSAFLIPSYQQRISLLLGSDLSRNTYVAMLC